MGIKKIYGVRIVTVNRNSYRQKCLCIKKGKVHFMKKEVTLLDEIVMKKEEGMSLSEILSLPKNKKLTESEQENYKEIKNKKYGWYPI